MAAWLQWRSQQVWLIETRSSSWEKNSQIGKNLFPSPRINIHSLYEQIISTSNTNLSDLQSNAPVVASLQKLQQYIQERKKLLHIIYIRLLWTKMCLNTLEGPSLIFFIWSLYFASSWSSRAIFLSTDSPRLSI